MSKIIIANWKMDPQTYEEAESLFFSVRDFLTDKKVSSLQTVICPPLVWLTDLSHKHQTLIKFGAQNVFWEKEGSYTGEISSIMLRNSKVEYVIIGHSERRYILAETDEMINKKLKASLEAGLKPILCIGERERESLGQAEEFVKFQLQKNIVSLREMPRNGKNLIVAYEPVWAISGSGGTADKPEQSLEVIRFIREWLEREGLQNVRTVYGGSVDEENLESFIKYPEIEGALVGNTSLNPVSFRKIIEIAEKYS